MSKSAIARRLSFLPLHDAIFFCRERGWDADNDNGGSDACWNHLAERGWFTDTLIILPLARTGRVLRRTPLPFPWLRSLRQR